MIFPKLFITPLILTIGVFPFTMNSADIYEHSRGGGRIISNLNENIITDDYKLNSTILIVRTKEEYMAPEIYSKCRNAQKLAISEKIGSNFIYIINLNYIGSCDDNVVYVKNGDEIYTDTAYLLNIKDYSKNFTDFTDLSNKQIEEKIARLDVLGLKLDEQILSLKQKGDLASKINLIKSLYDKKFEEYENIFLSNILSTRKSLRYNSPVAGKVVPTKKNIIPNTPRPYRAKYTDGVHHGWDIFANRGTPVQALSDGIVVRIVKDFNWSKFDNILWRDISDEDKAKNLDIYRGNQVWLKAADGNVIIYSHLENIPANLKQWQYVKEGEYFGQIGRSGVPDKEYKDFHLHFEIQLNPYLKADNSPLDIMKWKYFGKGLSYDGIIKSQTKLFSEGGVSK